MQSFALSVMTEKPDGALGHVLYVVEASNVDAAEARVLNRLTEQGFRIRGLLSRSTALSEASLARPA